MIMDLPATKRQRTKGPETEAAPEIKRSEPWFDDGNIILETEHTQFRVYRGVLAAASDVFKNIFSIPQPPSLREDVIEGCPVVHMTDSAKDLRFVLKALCERSYAPVGMKSLPLEVVASFLRLGRKYDIPLLLDEAITRVTYEFPSTLVEFDGNEACAMIDASITMAIDITRLGRDNNLLSVVPSALFICSIDSEFDVIFDGLIGSDGIRSTLSLDDQRACILGWRRLIEMQREKTLAWMGPSPITNCTSPTRCSEKRSALRNVDQHLYPVPKFEALGHWDGTWTQGMCTVCEKNAKTSHQRGRKAVWDELPLVFGLAGWDELLKS